jgi:hypothetical protein
VGDPARMERGAAWQPGDVQQQDDVTDETGGTTFTRHGAIPPVLGFPDRPHRSASDLAFGPPGAPAQSTLPLQKPGDVQATSDRLEAQRLLESNAITSGDDAIAALNLLLQLPANELTQVVDHLDDTAVSNLCDRLTDDQREKFAPLIDAAQDPKRRSRGLPHGERHRQRDVRVHASERPVRDRAI